MLRKITLENFMSHGHTVIELADGLTVLTGPNNCGKSAVVAALQILATNGRSTHVLRHGAKKCCITVETDDGHIIRWERNKTTVKYTIDGEDIHRLGNNSIPDSLHDVLRLDRVITSTGQNKDAYDIHFGEQKSPVFLLGDTGSRAAAFFASSSDAARLVEMQHRHRSQFQVSKQEAKRLTGERDKNEARLRSFEPLEPLAEQLAIAKSAHDGVQELDQLIVRLKGLIVSLNRQAQQQQWLRVQSNLLARLDQAQTSPDDLHRANREAAGLRTTASELSRLNSTVLSTTSQVAGLASLSPAPVMHDIARLRRVIDDLASVLNEKQIAERIIGHCAALTSPPVLEPSAVCQRMLEQIHFAEEQYRRKLFERDKLEPLLPAPIQHDTKQLRLLITNMATGQQHQRAIAMSKSKFESLSTPPQENDVSRLISTIDKLKQASATIAQAAKKAMTADQLLGNCKAKIFAFVAANPKCGTCGASIDAGTLMSTLPKLHAHEAGDNA